MFLIYSYLVKMPIDHCLLFIYVSLYNVYRVSIEYLHGFISFKIII